MSGKDVTGKVWSQSQANMKITVMRRMDFLVKLEISCVNI